MGNAAVDPDLYERFRRAFEEKLTFTGAISYHKLYTDAPNPGLSLSELGPIGLPLNPREAQVIKSHAQQVVFGQGERMVNDAPARDTWQMDATSITFKNPAWKTWLQGVVIDVCQSLGVNCATSAPRCDLRKLLLCETGSHYLPHVDATEVDGMFATIVIVLPSQFRGGAAHLSHGSVSNIYNCSKHSDIQTSVMAWYTDVTHESKPIVNGYRLTLSYNLIHTTTTPRPALSDNETAKKMLRDALLAWKASEGPQCPEKVVYLLEDQYPQETLRKSALKGRDAQHATLIEALAKELGFRVGLASVECHLSGETGDSEEYYARPRKRGWSWCVGESDSEEDDVDPDSLYFNDIDERETTISNLVDLNGVELAEEVDIEERTEIIPVDLEETIANGDHTKQEYDSHEEGTGWLERWYSRTVLVIWPKYASYLITGDLDSACDELYDIHSEIPTPDELAYVEFLIRQAKNDPQSAATVVDGACHVACQWRDAELWKRAIDVCSKTQGVTTLDVESLCTAIRTFGFDTVKSSVETMIRHEWRNKQLFAFFDELRAWDWVKEEELEESKQGIHNMDTGEAVLTWIEEQSAAALKALRKPQKDDFPTILQLALANGGLPYLRDSILPQLSVQADAAILKDFATHLDKEHDIAADVSLKRTIVALTLKAAISKLDLTSLQPSYESYQPERYGTIPAVVLAKSYFEACLDLQCPELVNDVLEKIAEASTAIPADAQRRSKVMVLPCLAYITEYLKTHPEVTVVPDLSGLQKTAVSSILDGMIARPYAIARTDVASFLQIFALTGGANLFVATVFPKLHILASTEGSASALLEELHAQRQLLSPTASYNGPSMQEVIAVVVKRYADLASITTCDRIVSAIDLCIRVQALDGVWALSQRALDVQKLKQLVMPTTSTYLGNYAHRTVGSSYNLEETFGDRVLIPLVPALRQLALKYNMLDALAPAFRMIIRVWVQKILGPLPPDPTARVAAVRRWMCTCQECKTIRTWLLAKPDRSFALHRIGAPKRKHVESFLAQYVTREAATWETISTSPQGLRVTKTELLHGPGQWKANQAKAVKMIHDVSSNAEERKRILGDELVEFAKWMKGLSPTTASAIATSGAISTANSRSTFMPGAMPSSSSTQQRSALAATSSATNSGPSVVRRMSIGSGQIAPPAKRRKTGEPTSVVDLTSP